MRRALHALLATTAPHQTRAFLRDHLGLAARLLERQRLLLPAEVLLAGGGPAWTLAVPCADLRLAIAELQRAGASCPGAVVDRGFGPAVVCALPGGGALELYEPPAATPPELLCVQPTFPVRDVGAAAAFYREALLLAERRREPRLAVLGRDGVELTLVHADAPAPARAYLVVRGIDALYAACRRCGASVIRPLHRRLDQVREFAVRDPDGHVLGVGEAE